MKGASAANNVTKRLYEHLCVNYGSSACGSAKKFYGMDPRSMTTRRITTTLIIVTTTGRRMRVRPIATNCNHNPCFAIKQFLRESVSEPPPSPPPPPQQEEYNRQGKELAGWLASSIQLDKNNPHPPIPLHQILSVFLPDEMLAMGGPHM